MNWPGRSVFGVDATDGTLKAVHLRRQGQKLRLLGSWRLPYHRHADPEVGAQQALATFFATARPDTFSRIVLALPDAGHQSRTYVVPAMQAERVSDLVRYELLAELQTPEEDVLLRHHVRKGVLEQQVHAVAFPAARVAAFVDGLLRERLPFDELQPPGFALASFVEHQQPRGRDRLALGVGECATELVLLRDDGLWTRHLPLGRSHVPSVAHLAERLAIEVEAAVTFLLPRDSRFQPVDLVLTEEGALGPALTTELKRVMRLPVTRFGEWQRIAIPEGRLAGNTTAIETLCMGKALGLALAGLGRARFSCPLVEGTPRRAALRLLPIAGLGLVLSSFGLFGVTELAWQRERTLAASLAGDLPGEMTGLVRRAEETKAEMNASARRADGLLALARRRPDVLAVRSALARLAGVLTSRGAATLHLDNVWLSPGDAGRPGRLTLTLDADPALATDLAARLQAAFEGSFERVAVGGPSVAPDVSLQRWTVELELP